MNMRDYQSWGRYRHAEHVVLPQRWRFDELAGVSGKQSILPYGKGRSYGDSCLNDGGIIVPTENLDHFIHFDTGTGVLSCESGVTLAQLLELAVPRGWFLPVTPGTKFATLGGAIANDVHGKNHHVAGTFGCHVRKFELLRSDGSRLICSATENSDYYQASIGGLGLTGLITWAEIQLKKISTAFIEREAIIFSNLKEFLALSLESDRNWEYTVAWVDCLSAGKSLGRGIYYRGRHHEAQGEARAFEMRKTANLKIPFDAPSFLLNTTTVKSFNAFYYHKQLKKCSSGKIHYDPFFYPLDGIHEWNRLYGKQGFFQFQCVIADDKEGALEELLKRISKSGQGSFLSVLKRFGNSTSPGMLSFPRTGITLALDFANKGQKTMRLLDELEQIVVEAGGAIYPAKDAIMKARHFQQFYPKWKDFCEYLDPRFSSSFWRRVSGQS